MKPAQQTLDGVERSAAMTQELCCSSQKDGNTISYCGECENCKLNRILMNVRQWFYRLGDHSKQMFLFGLIQTIDSHELIKYLAKLLTPMMSKDYLYTRTRLTPSLASDKATASSDKALPARDVQRYLEQCWQWFSRSSYWSKCNFLLAILQICDGHLLNNVNNYLWKILAAEEMALLQTDDAQQAESISNRLTDSSKTSHSNRKTNLLENNGQLVCSIPQGDTTEDDDVAFVPDSHCLYDKPASRIRSADLCSGSSRYRDFMRSLPVHLAKYILSMLDQATLYNSLCVSKNWRVLVEEVHKELYVNQQLREEVMLMQGASAQGANPNYANDVDVLVPNIDPDTLEVLETDDAVIEPQFKSEVTLATAYSGMSTRRIIMEERNVFCGPYNVMVLIDKEDAHRVMHTLGGTLIALGSKDRHIRFINSETGKECGPVITGHAGSIRSVHLCEAKGVVISGSYDLSIRVWDLKTGHCKKILRGHRDTVVVLSVLKDIVASGARDNTCKLWNLDTGKMLHSLHHKLPVSAVALGKDKVISGCEGGKVKVWDIRTGELIKTLSGHHGAVMAIRFDKWHIVTGGRDGYALTWSTQGKHDRCLSAFRHPTAVLCLDFMYLRIITGCADGRLRIWNMITGQCCRIMRGNSRSEPIQNIIASGNRITVNTHINLLVLNFEKIEWDYSLSTDEVPPLVRYGRYSDAPIRKQPYTYVRAKRMCSAGASNTKLLHHSDKSGETGYSPENNRFKRAPCSAENSYTENHLLHEPRTPQLPHSARSLSARMMKSASRIQSLKKNTSASAMRNLFFKDLDDDHDLRMDQVTPCSRYSNCRFLSPTTNTMHQLDRHSNATPGSVNVISDQFNVLRREEEDDDKATQKLAGTPALRQRRLSWACGSSDSSKSKHISLAETKAALRAHIRQGNQFIVSPDFISSDVVSVKPPIVDLNRLNPGKAKLMSRQTEIDQFRPRPYSSPSKVDTRTKIALDKMNLEQFKISAIKFEHVDDTSVSNVTTKVATALSPSPPTEHAGKPSDKRTLIRAHTSNAVSRIINKQSQYPPISYRPATAGSALNKMSMYDHSISNIDSATPYSHTDPLSVKFPDMDHDRKWITSSSREAVINSSPLIYSRIVIDKCIELQQPKMASKSTHGSWKGNLNDFDNPLLSNLGSDLKTYNQEEESMKIMLVSYLDSKS